MTRTKYPDEFKEQVVREILEKERTIASVVASYDLVPQTVGGWVAKYKKKHAEDQDPEAAAESAEIARLRAENRELRAEMRVLEKNGCLLRERTSVSERYELIRREEGNYPVASMCELVGVSKSGHLRLAGPARGRHEGQKEEAGTVGRVRVQGLRHDSAGTGAPPPL